MNCWTTGGRGSWSWDQINVTLLKGPNTIEFTPSVPMLVDHLNVLFAGSGPVSGTTKSNGGPKSNGGD